MKLLTSSTKNYQTISQFTPSEFWINATKMDRKLQNLVLKTSTIGIRLINSVVFLLWKHPRKQHKEFKFMDLKFFEMLIRLTFFFMPLRKNDSQKN